MQYMGGKTRQGRHIASQILNYSTECSIYLEPFVGGASVLALVGSKFRRAIASDTHADLILMWTALRDGWNPPDMVTEEEYEQLRTAEPSALRGFVGFGCSFGGKWFGGYARSKPDPRHTNDFCRAAKVSIERKLRGFGNVSFSCCDYREHSPSSGTVVYCDPPYFGTQGYNGVPQLDRDEFWNTMRKWSKSGAVVLVSEYGAPEDVPCVWSNGSLQTIRLRSNVTPATERLYLLGSPVVQADLFDGLSDFMNC